MTVQVICNATWQWDGDARLVRAATHAPTHHPGWLPRVVGYVEMRTRRDKPVDADRILDDGWDVNQDTSTGARAGSAVAVRDTPGWSVKDARGFLGSLAGRRVQARHVVHDIVRHREGRVRYVDHYLVGHSPLESTDRQDDFERSVARRVRRVERRARLARARSSARIGRTRTVHRWAFLGDGNAAHPMVRRALGGHDSVGVDVMVAVYSRGWGQLSWTAEHLPGSDHHRLVVSTSIG